MGLNSAAQTFQRLMETVLGKLQWRHCLCYLDDIIIFGKTFDEALQNHRLVFECLKEANLKLKPSKCFLFRKEVTFLGHLVSEEGIKCDPAKIECVKNWPKPRNVTEIKSFLGFAGYYRKFLLNFSMTASPLIKLTRKNQKFLWTNECDLAFEKLKDMLTSAPLLSFPNDEDIFILDTDASLSGIGAVLSQLQGGHEKVISYASRTLSKSQRNYCVTKRELLAVVTFVRQFRHYLWGRKFIIRTDHASLTWLRNFKEPEGMLARWISILDNYKFEIQYRRGTLHTNADALSRMPSRKCKKEDCSECYPKCRPFFQSQTEENVECRVCNQTHSGDCPAVMAEETEFLNSIVSTITETETSQSQNSEPNWLDFWSLQEIKIMQENDPAIGDIHRIMINQEEKPLKQDILNLHPEAKVLWGLWELLQIKNDILYKVFVKDDGNQIFQLVAPQQIREIIFHQLHHNKIAGHFGKDKTLGVIRNRFYWPGMTENIKQWCSECDFCARCKAGPGLGKSPLKQSQSCAPLERIGIDIVGPLPVTENGNEYIIVLGDYFSKWKEAYPVPNHTAMTVADKVITEFICRFGCPLQIHSDQGKEFESNLFQIICQKLGVQKTRSTPYRPQSSGLVERYNRTLKQMLSIFVNSHRNDWDDHIPYIMMAYRSTVHSTTKCTPNSLMLGHEIRCPVDLMFGLPVDHSDFCPIEYVEWVKQALRNAFSIVYEHSGEAAKRQKYYYDRGLKARSYEPNSWVWRWYPPKINQALGLGWTGPYLVIEKMSDVTYKIQKDIDANPIIVHVDHLKPYLGRNQPENWLLQPSILQNTNTTHDLSNSDHFNDNTDKTHDTSFIPVSSSTPVPVRTRTGRVVKPRDRYSP